MLQYKSPGVYIEEIDSLPPSIAAVATAIPVFIGYTKVLDTDDLHLTPTRITSMLEYIELFGTAPNQAFDLTIDQLENAAGQVIDTQISLATAVTTPSHYLYYCVQLYFANGGGPCYVLSVGPYNDGSGTTSPSKNDFLGDSTATPPTPSVFAILEEYDEPTLIVSTDAATLSNDDHMSIVDEALMHCNKMQDRFVIADVHNAVLGGTDDNSLVTTNFRGKISTDPDYLKYGAAYFPYLRTSISFIHDDTTTTITNHNITLEDGSASSTTALSGTVASNTNMKDTHNELYYAIQDFVSGVNVVLPPSSGIAGVYARVDKNIGVWKAPANVGLSRVVAPMVNVTNDMNDGLNVDSTGKSVNPIRTFTGKGSMVWGARTLNAGDLNWRFVNVRREVIFIEESIKKALEHFVFEPNTANTWVKVKTMINAFLTSLWKAGGLAGQKSEDAFEVNIGVNITMTPMEVAQGIMIAEVILVPPRPAEVIILRVSQKLQVS